MGAVNKTATEWLVARFLDVTAKDEDDSFGILVEKHFPDDAAMRHLARIVRGADAPERFDVMPESAGLRAIVEGFAAKGRAAAEMYDALLASLRQRLERDEPLESGPLLDPVSGLANRFLFLDRLEQAIAYAHRHDALLAVCLVRFDFEPVAGHIDRVCREIADRLHHTIRELDTIARLGASEFGVILNDLRSRANADVAVAKMSEALSQPFDLADRAYEVTRNIGMSFYPAHGHDAAMLLNAARQAATDVAVPVSVFGE